MKAISRNEKYLSKLSGEEEVVPKPISRKEKYMYRACGYIDKPIPKHAISREEKYWKKIIENGGGGSAVLTSKDITENGLYNAADDEADGYSSVNVDVPNTYLLSDEGKVVSNGDLVSQTSTVVSQNGVVDTTLIDSVNVNVPNINNILFAPPQKFKSNGSNLLDYKIYGNNTPHIAQQTSVLPLTFTAKGGNAVDWVIYGNDDVGENHWHQNAYSTTINDVSISADTSSLTISSNGSSATISASDNVWKNAIKTLIGSGEYTYQYAITGTHTHMSIGFYKSDNTSVFTSNQNTYSGTFTSDNAEYYTGFYLPKGWSGNITVTQMLVKGSTAPDHYIPYQQGVGERTENLFDKESFVASATKHNATCTETSTGITVTATSSSDPYVMSAQTVGGAILVDTNTQYVFSCNLSASLNMYMTQYDSSFTAVAFNRITSPYVFTPNANVKYIGLRFGNNEMVINQEYTISDIMLVKGSTAPSTYIPYGYEIPIYLYPSNLPQIKKDLIGAKVHETQVTSRKGNEILTWDVIGIDHDECYYADGRRAAHSVTLQLHDCFASLQFDEREALFYAESAMPAGTYHFTVREQPWYASDVGKTFQFTLTQTLAAGSQICITNAYNATMASGKIKTFSDGSSTTAIETVDITEGSDGTDLGDVRSALVGQNTNSIQRALLGSNNWANSAVRQWLNSSAAAGSVWTPKTKFDRPPSWVSSIAGFLNGMDEDFVKAVGTVKKTTALNTVTDGGGTVESDEKFFLLSRSEVYGGDEVTGGEGTAYSYYSDYSDLSGAGIGADTNRIKYRNGAAQYWWPRSPYATYANNVRCVLYTGNVNNSYVINSGGVAPAICIPMDEVYDCNEVDIYIGDSPLTAGQSISKTSTGVDIATTEGENTISSTLYNKPETAISYVDFVGVGEKSGNDWQIPVKINSTTTNVPIDAPLVENEYVSYIDQKIYHYIDGTLTPVDPPSTLPHIATANGVNELSIDVEVQPELVGIGLGNPIELVNT